MAPTACSAKGDDPSLLRRTRRVRGKGKPKYKFGKDALLTLQQCFEKNPYPDYTTREEIARAVGCPLSVLQNWFQNKRSRLLPGEKQRIFTNWKRRCDIPEQNDPPACRQDPQIQMPTNTSEQVFHAQGALPGSAGQPAMEIQGMYGSYNLSTSSASLYGANTERGSSPTSIPESYLYQGSFGQYFAQGPAVMGESWPATYYFFDYYSV